KTRRTQGGGEWRIAPVQALRRVMADPKWTPCSRHSPNSLNSLRVFASLRFDSESQLDPGRREKTAMRDRRREGRRDPPTLPYATVAPEGALRREMRMLQDREVLRTTLAIEQEIFLQSLTGRAHEGHGTFAGRRYVDTTEDDVALSLGLDPVRA